MATTTARCRPPASNSSVVRRSASGLSALRNSLLTLTLSLLVAGSAWAERGSDTVSRSFELRAGATVDVANVNGNIRVESWSGSELKIEATKKAEASTANQVRELLEDIEILFDETADGLQVRVDLPDRGWFDWLAGKRQANVDFELLVPENLVALARTVNGSVTAEGSTGELEARSTNGRIRITDATGPVRAKTTNGSIRAGLAEVTGPVELTTTNGTIDLDVAPGTSADLEARTTNGRIRTGEEVRVDSINSRRTSLRGTLGAGGPRITLRAVNGGITVGQ